MTQHYMPIAEQLLILNALIVEASRSLQNQPEGSLLVHHKGGSDQYYWKKNSGRSYLTKKERSQAAKLAQKTYDKAFLRLALIIRDELESIQNNHCTRSASFMYQPLAKVYTDQSLSRQSLIRPYVLPDDLLIKDWLSVSYEGLPFSDQDPMILTDRGERVRSKSEKIIADKLYSFGIPYRYEYPLYLSTLGTIHPDFMLLDLSERSVVYLEHFGLMQDPGYNLQAMNKIDCYRMDGYHMDDKLLCTFEGGRYVFHSAAFESILQQRFSLS